MSKNKKDQLLKNTENNEYQIFIMEGKNKNEMVDEMENEKKDNSQQQQFRQQSSQNRDKELQKVQNLPENQPQFKSQSSISAKKVDEKKVQVKKTKIIIEDFHEYLPQLLIEINHHKPKNIIRMGKDYQAEVPKNCQLSYVYRPLNHLKIWGKGEFNRQVFKKFRQKFGEGRTEEDMILQLYQYQCDWDQIWNYLKNNNDLRKFYLQKDRSRF